MSTYSTNEFKAGLKVMIDADPYNILENESVKPGKGQAFNRVKMRNLKTGRVLERTMKSGDTLEGADVIDLEVQFLYADAEGWHFMQPESFEQFTANEAPVADSKQWLKEQDLCFLTLWNGIPLVVTPPNHVVLRISFTEPGLRGDSSSSGSKPATVETGAVIRVPLFVQIDDMVRVDTRTGDYVARVKE